MSIKNKWVMGVISATVAIIAFMATPVVLAQSETARMANATHKKTQTLEAKMREMAAMMAAMQRELEQLKAQSPASKVQELEAWVAATHKNISSSTKKQSYVAFRGGYARNDHDRTGNILTDANTDESGSSGIPTRAYTGNKSNGNQDAWYFGAELNHHLNDDLFGLMDDTDVLAEIMFEYKEFDSTHLNRAPLATSANSSADTHDLLCKANKAKGGDKDGEGAYGYCSNNVTVSQFTLTASPKIRFMDGSDFRPWIIPAGFAFHVISPPSDGVTVLTVGAMFAAGADYKIWKDIYVGVDARYHLVNNDSLDGVEIDGFTAGGYIGLGFN